MRTKIAIDIGSYYTKIYKSSADIVLYEPTLLILKNGNYKNIDAIGIEAEKKLGKTTNGDSIIHPIVNSEIVDEKALLILLSHFLKKIKEPLEGKPDVIVSVQLGTTRETIKKLEGIFEKLGIYNITFVENPVISLLGINAPIGDTKSAMIIDMGSSQTTICSLTLGGIIAGVSLDIGGNTLNQNIIDCIEASKDLSVSEFQAEKIKRSLASLEQEDNNQIIISGKDTKSGKPRSETITASDIYLPVKSYIDRIQEITTMILQKLPNETLEETQNNGIFLTGGGSNLYGLADHLSLAFDIPVHFNYQGDMASAIGAGVVVNNPKLLNKIQLKIN